MDKIGQKTLCNKFCTFGLTVQNFCSIIEIEQKF